MQTASAPDQMAYAQLASLKGAVKLEGLGMKHSSGKSMRKVAARLLGMKPNAKADDVIGALNREMERLVSAAALWQLRHGKTTHYAVRRLGSTSWKLSMRDANGDSTGVELGVSRRVVLR